jgi:hypothetical protein
MRYPRRVPAHIKADKSFRLLKDQTPETWIVRDVSQDDYGIDCYIELVPDSGDMTGHLVSVQLKSSDAIRWRASAGSANSLVSTFSGIRTTTTNYWMGMQIPVFLCVADLAENSVYWVNAKSQIRSNYTKATSQESISFLLHKSATLGSNGEEDEFLLSYFRERAYDSFHAQVADLIVHAAEYYELIGDHGWQDPFLESEIADTVMATRLYNTLYSAAAHLGIEWNQVPLSERFEQDAETWGQACSGLIHEATLGKLLHCLQPTLTEVLKRTVETITVLEGDYWRSSDPLLWSICACTSTDSFQVLISRR